MERPTRRPDRLTRVLAAIGRSALLTASGAAVLGIGALPSVLSPRQDEVPPKE